MILASIDLRLDALVVVLIACAVAVLVIAYWRWSLDLVPTLVLALVIRVVVAYLARPITPFDVTFWFQAAGHEIAQGRDPTLSLPAHNWNFLPMMPYIWDGLQHIGLPWVDVVKIPVILCDVTNVWLVGILSGKASAGRTRLLYALSPIAIIVTSYHGQVDPISLTLLLAGIVLIRQQRDIAAGLLFGFAIASKTWPVLIIAAVLIGLPRSRSYRIVPPIVAVLACFFLSSVVFLASPPLKLARALVSYTSFVSTWGWAGTLLSFGHPSIRGYDSSAALPGTILIAIAVILVVAVFRRSTDLVRAWTAPMAMLMVTAGFGPQYLLWPLPTAIAAGEATSFYTVAATAFMLALYLPLFPLGVGQQEFRQAFRGSS